MQAIRESVWPKGGWRRAASYVTHRIRRLPDTPHRVARGMFTGVFASFTPFFGLHWLLALGMSWTIRGNYLAALIGTFAGNPLTTPFVAYISVEIGHWIMGDGGGVPLSDIFSAFGQAGTELWANVRAIFTDDVTRWTHLGHFMRTVYLPYLVGGIVPGIVAGLASYYITIPLVRGYQKLRSLRLKERIEKARAAKALKLRSSDQA